MIDMKRVVGALVLILMCCGEGQASLLPAHEWRMIRQIAADYRLNEDETWLLAAIRRLENGRPGLEFGVGCPMDSADPPHHRRIEGGMKRVSPPIT